MAVALRYIRSDMGASSDADMVPDNAFAADIAGYLEKYVILGNSECLWSFGFNVSNIGTEGLLRRWKYQPILAYDVKGWNWFTVSDR